MIMALKMALRSIGANKLRAVLTMLGIIIGVMALVVLVSLVSGATGSIAEAISGLGSDLLSVSVSDDKGRPVRLEDLDAWVDQRPEVGAMSPYSSATLEGKGGADSGSVTVYGVTPGYQEINGQQLLLGRYLKNTDVKNVSRVCVLDRDTAEKLTGYPDCVGEEISLGGVKYVVVGVIKTEETLAARFLMNGLNAWVPYSSLIRLATDLGPNLRSFYVGPGAGYTVEQAEEAVRELLLERFRDDGSAFRVSSQNLIEEAMNNVNSVLTILLGSIAAISLIVGGIGIMNIMLVTVTERTREIGIRKAIGASRGSILVQFLLEAVVLCMLGCALGIFISWGILRIISVIIASTEMKLTLQTDVVLLSVGFCFAIGVIFGLYPANKAAKMKPIDALHYGG